MLQLDTMKKEIFTIMALGVALLTFSSCESPGEKAKRMAIEELQALNIVASQYDAQLVEAAAKGSVKRMHLLLTAGADVNTSRADGTTALMAAVQSRNPEAVQLVLDAGAGVHAKNAKGETALHLAAAGGNRKVVELLLKKGADSNEGDLLSAAEKNGHKEIVDLLNSSRNNYYLLLSAAMSGRTEVVKNLLTAPGIDVNRMDKDGHTALYYATRNGYKEVVKVLLGAPGIDVNCGALSIAEYFGYTEVVKLLKEAGAKK